MKIYCPTTLQPAALLRVAATQTSSRTVSREALLSGSTTERELDSSLSALSPLKIEML